MILEILFFSFFNPDNYFFNFLEILPTKYDFGLFIRYDTVLFEEPLIKLAKNLNSNKDFIMLKEKLEKLAKDFNYTLKKL